MDKIELVARAMCAAVDINPDAESGKGPAEAPVSGFQTYTTEIRRGLEPWPHWKTKMKEARAFIAAFDVLTALREAEPSDSF